MLGELLRGFAFELELDEVAEVLHLFAGSDGKSPMQRTWNAQAEHPLGAGVCANCHAPTLHSPTLDYDVREAQGVAKSGIHCDYCHKVSGMREPTGRDRAS